MQLPQLQATYAAFTGQEKYLLPWLSYNMLHSRHLAEEIALGTS